MEIEPEICPNPDCDSQDIEYLGPVELTCEVRHDHKCNYCNTTFSIYTRLGRVSIRKEVNHRT